MGGPRGSTGGPWEVYGRNKGGPWEVHGVPWEVHSRSTGDS